MNINSSRRGRMLLVLTATLASVLGALVVPTSSAAPAAAPAAPDCGPAVKKSGGLLFDRYWECTFSDDFTGTALDETKWSPLESRRSGVPTAECRIGSSQTIGVSRGTLQLTVRDLGRQFLCEAGDNDYWTQYVGGAVTTAGKFDQTFGRVEVRAKFPHSVLKGLHSAIWMWPAKQIYKDLSAELDIVEWRSISADRAVPTAVYDMDTGATAITNWRCFIDDAQKYHTYAMEWTRSGVTFLYDGAACLTHEWEPASPLQAPAPFDEAFFLNLNQSAGKWHNAADENTEFPATMTVDYVKIWQ